MKIQVTPYNIFVIPFLIGVALLLVICLYKYIRWIGKFNKQQRETIRKNWLSWKIFSAVWEMFREGLLHVKIFKKNFLLGVMHQAYALGWFLLITVGFVESTLTIKHLQQENSIARVHELEKQGDWYVKEQGADSFDELELEGAEGLKINYKRPFYVSIFYRYFIHDVPESFRSAHRLTNLMDGLLLYVFLGLTMAIIKIMYSKVLGMRRTTKHTIVDRFSKFALWGIFPLRLLAESVTACLYGNGGFVTQTVGNMFDPMIVQGMEHSLWMFYSVYRFSMQ